MEKSNPLQPFWYDTSRKDDKIVLNRVPKDKRTRDEDAGGTRFHTRNTGEDNSCNGNNGGINMRKRALEQNSGELNKRRTFNEGPVNSCGFMDSDILITSDDSHHNHNKQFDGIPSQCSYTNVMSSESVYHFESNRDLEPRIPSSPPAESKDRRFPLNSSPQIDFYQEDGEPFSTSQATVIPIDMDDSENDLDPAVNFNVSTYHKVHGYLSSDSFSDEGDVNDEELNIHARGIISQCIEEGTSKVHFENLRLKVIPDDIEDLKNLICMGRNGIEVPDIEIYATHNKLKILPPTLFNVKNITVLSLRDNLLKKIPGKIQRLQKLTYLSIVSNELKVVPYQILNLPNLVNLLVRPNLNLIELNQQDPSSYFCVNDESANYDLDVRRYVSKVKFIDVPMLPTSSQISRERSDREILETVTSVPKLSELSLRRISRYNVSFSETKNWRKQVPFHIQLKIAKSFQKGIYDETCSVCNIISVNPVAKSLEWWDFKSQKLIPVRRNFCCGNCVKVWLDDVEECRKRYETGDRSRVEVENLSAAESIGTEADFQLDENF